MGDTVQVFVKVVVTSEDAVPSGTAGLNIDGRPCVGEWTKAILISANPPTACVQICEGPLPPQNVSVHVDQIRPMPEGPGPTEPEEPLHPAVAARDGVRVSDTGDGHFNVETCDGEYAYSA